MIFYIRKLGVRQTFNDSAFVALMQIGKYKLSYLHKKAGNQGPPPVIILNDISIVSVLKISVCACYVAFYK